MRKAERQVAAPQSETAETVETGNSYPAPEVNKAGPKLQALRETRWLAAHPGAALPSTPVPCMLTQEEREMLSFAAGLYAEDGNAICDLGSFAGGSAYHLAWGLRAMTPISASRVHAYDFFEIPDNRKSKMLYRHGFPRFTGTDFLPSVRRLLAEVDEHVVYHKGDFLSTKWTGGNISILHVDISKSYALNSHILNEFATKLVPGVSLVVHQDYQHWSNPWVAASMELLQEYFELLSWTSCNSVLFACLKQLPPGIGSEVDKSLRNPETMRMLLKGAAKRFPGRPQKESLAKSLLAYETNPGIERAWQFKLDLQPGSNLIARLDD